MDKHAFIYSEIPMYSSVLGWILQQSSSYQSNYFVFNEYCYKAEERNDPWDNHSDDPNDWSHAFIEDVEDENLSNDFTWLNEFVDSFKCNTIFGLSYGAWGKNKSWHNNNINEIIDDSELILLSKKIEDDNFLEKIKKNKVVIDLVGIEKSNKDMEGIFW